MKPARMTDRRWPGSEGTSMTRLDSSDQALAIRLAELLMGWKWASGRFLLGDRQWRPAWYFQPERNLGDAYSVLAASCAEEYSMGAKRGSQCWCRVRIAGVEGRATSASMARAITHAIARAVGIDVEGRP